MHTIQFQLYKVQTHTHDSCVTGQDSVEVEGDLGKGIKVLSGVP